MKTAITELALFKELGVPFEHIYGAEGGNRKARWRVQTAQLTLVFIHCWPALKTCSPWDRPFTFVHLDLCGQFARDKLKILRNIRLTPKAYVIVNLRVGREQPWLQDLLAREQKICRVQRSSRR